MKTKYPSRNTPQKPKNYKGMNMECIIELNNVDKKFDNKTVVDNLNLKINKGEIFGFLGPNGAGKSTTINMIVGILNPTSGEILIEGKKIKDYDKSKLGICPQEIILWDRLTCFENLYTIGKLYDMDSKTLTERINELLEKLHLADEKNTKVDKLSGGMKRRINIAMATIHNPELLILDEPSEGLDPQSRRLLWNYILHQKKSGKTIILTTHLMDEADFLSDRVAIINNGKLVSSDTPYNLKSSIGEGDIVDITVDKNTEKIIKDFKKIEGITNIVNNNGIITLNLLNATSKLPELIKIIEMNNSNLIDIKMRQNTLEDVFIELTGKELVE